ncbi:MAG: hypothetical protein WCH99_21515, partial [Verrucomicrobiota bacterium]
VFSDEDAAGQTRLAKLSKIFVDFGVGENGFAAFGIGGDEVERMAGEKPVKTLESGLWRRCVTADLTTGIHAQDCSGGL